MLKIISEFFSSKTTIDSKSVKNKSFIQFFLENPIPRKDGAMKFVLGDRWKEVPVPKIFELANIRFGSNGEDREQELEPLLELLMDCERILSRDQLDFLLEFDHLPLSKTPNLGIWLDGDELSLYKKNSEELAHQRKMDYYIAITGIIRATINSR